MGKAWGRNLSDNPRTEVAAWVDIQEGAGAAAAKQLGIEVPVTGTDLRAAIEQAQPDFVVDVTIPEAHCEVTVTALGLGLPVLGEKPMANSLEEARRMVEASEKAGKLYMVSQSRRYDDNIAAYSEFVRSGLGDLGIVNADFYIGAHFGGFRDEMPSPLILDMAIHTFDQMRFITGLDAVAVYADEFNPSWSWYKGDACATAIFELSNGARFTYRGSWCAEGCSTTWECDWRVVGANGSALWTRDGLTGQTVKELGGFHSEFDTHTIEPKIVKGGIAGSLEEFLDALETGATPNGECHDNIKSLAMVFAAMESSRSGSKVKVGF
jgi:predicted dehydrogenase